MLVSTPFLTLDISLALVKAALHADSQIAALRYMHCQNLHVDTTPTNSTSHHIYKCSVCNKIWYENKVVNGDPLPLLGINMV